MHGDGKRSPTKTMRNIQTLYVPETVHPVIRSRWIKPNIVANKYYHSQLFPAVSFQFLGLGLLIGSLI